jgi:hypothetical protein
MKISASSPAKLTVWKLDNGGYQATVEKGKEWGKLTLRRQGYPPFQFQCSLHEVEDLIEVLRMVLQLCFPQEES